MKYSFLVLDPKRTIGKDGKPAWVGSRHGTAGWAAGVPTSAGTKLVKRFGYATKTDAEQAAQHAGKLLGLATDDATRERIGDMIATVQRGARRLAAGESTRTPPGPASKLLAEADGNRTRQRRGTPLTGFEDQGNHQESRRLRPRLY